MLTCSISLAIVWKYLFSFEQVVLIRLPWKNKIYRKKIKVIYPEKGKSEDLKNWFQF